MQRLSLIVFAVLCVLCLAHGAYYYPQLPGTVASHFNLSGQPDATSSKTTLLVVYFAVVAGIAAMILAFAYLMGRVSSDTLKLPHKAHWLAPANERKTRAFLASHMLWIGSATMLLFLDAFHQTFRVNLGLADTLTHFNWSLGLYLAFVVLWIVALLARFSRPESSKT